jgi:hypothetical protein
MDKGHTRSAWPPHSYENISFLQKRYESGVLSRHMGAQFRAIPPLRHKGQFVYEFVNSRGRVIYTPWYHTRARRPRRTSGVAPYGPVLPADQDVERAHTLTLRGQGIHRRLEMLQYFETALEWLAQGVL